MAEMVSLRGVSRTYSAAGGREVHALHDVDLAVGEGEFVIVTGRSGCGKTTLLNLMSGLAKPSAGTVSIAGTDIWGLDDRGRAALRSERLGFVFQFPSLLASLSAIENVMLPTMFLTGADRQAAGRRAEDLLGRVGLADKLGSFPRQLSAGQQQRVVIARALINEPALLLADEPTSDLDEQTEQEVMSLFRGIHEERGITIVLVTHTSQLVPYGTRSLTMAAGAIVRDEPHERADGVAQAEA
ncbi:MAG: ABC transporter ATP-binding protein [Anaerolineae bacterium]